MSYSAEYKEHIEYTFATFCKIVLRNASISAYRDFGRKQKREVSLDYLISVTPFEPFTTDNYLEQYDKPTVFVGKGQEVIVASKRLADALCRLSEQRRVVLLMYFFLGYTDEKIGKMYGRNRSTAYFSLLVDTVLCVAAIPVYFFSNGRTPWSPIRGIRALSLSSRFAR